MNTFENALAFLPKDKHGRIKKTLAQWRTSNDLGRLLHENIQELEHFLSETSMMELLTVIHDSSEDFFVIGTLRYQACCYKHGLKGGPVRSNQPAVIGRAVERRLFENWLFEQGFDYFGTRMRAAEFVQHLILGDHPNAFEEVFLLSKYASWCSWSPNGDPFEFRRSNNPDEVRASLGLWPQDNRSDTPLLLLTYPCQNKLDLWRPTIADAGLHPGFRPPSLTVQVFRLSWKWREAFRR